MSNKFVGIETRRQKKAKNISYEADSKVSPTKLAIKSGQADLSFEKEEEYIKNNKKLKTEYNSETKIEFLPPLNWPKKNLIECLALLRKCALNNDITYFTFHFYCLIP